MATQPYLDIRDLRGGINDSDSPLALALNQVVDARNVDYREGMLATKRKGLTPFNLSNSVFEREVPVAEVVNQGGWTALAGGTLAIGASAQGSNSDQMLIVRIATRNATDVTAVNLSGTPLTNLGQVSNATAGRLEVFYLVSPALGGGTLNVTLAGAADCAIIAERWRLVDTTVTPANFASSTGAASSTSLPSSNSWNGQFMAQAALAWTNTATVTEATPGVLQAGQQSNGNARVLSSSKIASKPTSQWRFNLSLGVDWIAFVWALRGKVAVASALNNSIHVLMRHQPTNDLSGDELWAQDTHGRLDRYLQSGGWQTGVPIVNYNTGAFVSDGLHGTNGVSLHGKFFLALDAGTLITDVLHVWDGSVLRPAGFRTPDVLVATDAAAGGTYSTARYFRFRYIEMAGSNIVRRSEPCAYVTFVPLGTKAGAVLTQPSRGVFIDAEGETHWEIEASVDGNLFYRISTQTIATTTYTDSTAFNGTSTYATAINPLSENIGEYVRSYMPRHVTVDQDRLLTGGSTQTPVLDSRVQWSVLRGDDGVGNDERVPVTSRFFQDIDALRGGRLTYMSAGVTGAVYVFKLQQVHKLVRTGHSTRAYDTHVESEGRGALLRGGCQAIDENGFPCVYFVDPNVGLCRFGIHGIEDLSQQRRIFMQRINKGAAISCRLLFYPKHWFVWVSLAIDGGSLPTRVGCFNVRTKSWTDYDGRMGTMTGATLFPDATSELLPYVCVSNPSTSLICRADNGVSDDGVNFRGYFVTRPYSGPSLQQKFGAMSAVLQARASNTDIAIKLSRDYGLESKTTEVQNFAASGAETTVTKTYDDASMSECFVLQFEVGDPALYTLSQLNQTWTLDSLAVKYRTEDESVS